MKLQTLKPRLQAQRTPKAARREVVQTGFRNQFQKLYNHDWRKARARFLQTNPLCKYCKDRFGRVTVATVVDHIIPHKGDKTLFWDQENWQPLCKYCHDSIKAKEEIKQGFI